MARNMTDRLSFVLARTSIAVAASLAALCCSAPVAAETVDQLYAMAKAEKIPRRVGSGFDSGFRERRSCLRAAISWRHRFTHERVK